MTAELRDLESSLHLFQPPLYRGREGSWTPHLDHALAGGNGPLTWNLATILSALGLGYAVGDGTLLEEVRRQPWLADCDRLEPIPPHDFLAATPQEAAQRLLALLREEAEEVCAGRSTIYVLLSGGLDSRIVAGVLAGLAREGRIAPPEAVTWGTPNSRDVVYGRIAAERLGFPWHHVELTPEWLLRNLEAAGTTLGGLVSPPHLHAMLWFADVPRDALVIASSWGDSVGRAEFSGRHVLELQPLQPNDAFGLLRRDVLGMAAAKLRVELEALRRRAPDVPTFVACEHEQQGHYMRGMIGHAMSIINQGCTLYQMFTHPRVYGTMWSIHPAMRVDDVYTELLEAVDPQLARLPWARTNRAMRERTESADPTLTPQYHDYAGWTAGPLYDEFRDRVDPDWFAATGIFDRDAVAALGEAVRARKSTLPGSGRRPYDLWLWLAGFRRFADWVAQHGQEAVRGEACDPDPEPAVAEAHSAGPLRHALRQNALLLDLVRTLRRRAMRQKALRRWPVRGSLQSSPRLKTPS